MSVGTETGVTDRWVYWRFKNGHENIGMFGETLWKRIMVGSGLYYVPLAQLPIVNGKGPRLQGSDDILPDFDVSGPRRAYMDSKCKTKPVLYKNANSLRHGIDRKCWEAYEAISGLNRQKCVLGIVELFHENGADWSGSLLMQTLGRLGAPVFGFSSESHMVYWPRRLFDVVGQLGELEMWNVAQGRGTLRDDIRLAVRSFFSISEKPIQSRMF